jgi:serine/threonine protein kinase/tetratricopeptide (TPR) repeat protein
MALDMDRMKEIFAAALDKSSAERGAFLDEACGHDIELRSRVDALLAADEAAGSFLPLPDGMETTAPFETKVAAGETLGLYTLIERIGEGGFGVVFLAEQQQPIRRRVALKVLKPGMDTHQVIARFAAEQQALALMDHPNIAKVYDAGAMPTGRPYFVMELVKGIAVTKYCDQCSLPIGARLELFLAVCQAVQHAHQKGVIHRDIKPSNVLVAMQDGVPTVKVIDFGVAKAINQRLTDQSLHTGFAQLIGTPLYMSPEQAEMSPLEIDTRGDIYSLGVLLYELLTGTTPFERERLLNASFDEMRRIIREEEPPLPSTRFSTLTAAASSTIANQRRTDGRRLAQALRGDLDWIVTKCLEKDRTRRYETAAALAADIQHYLADEPVTAAAPSRVYRVRKFVRRNRLLVFSVSAVFLALMAGGSAATIGLIGEAKQRAIAEVRERDAKLQADISAAVSQFQADLLTSADPQRLLGDKVTVLEVVTAALRELDAGKLHHKAQVEASVREIIGQTLTALGRYDLAEPNLKRALELRQRIHGADHVDTTESLTLLGDVLAAKGSVEEGGALLTKALTIRRAALPKDDLRIAQSQCDLSTTLIMRGNFAEAERLCRQALTAFRSTKPPNSFWEATAASTLATSLQMQGRIKEAEELFREVVAIRRETERPGHPLTATDVSALAEVLQLQDRLDEAEELSRESLEMTRGAYPVDHPLIAAHLNGLAKILIARGKYADAEHVLREAMEICQKAAPGNLIQSIVCSHLGTALQNQGRLAEAEPLLRDALTLALDLYPPGDVRIAQCKQNLAYLRWRMNHPEEAEKLFSEALDIHRASPFGEADHAALLGQFSVMLLQMGKSNEAEKLMKEALKIKQAYLPAAHIDLGVNYNNLMVLYANTGRLAEAEPFAREALKVFHQALPSGHWKIGSVHCGLGASLIAQKRFGEAEEELLTAEKILASANVDRRQAYGPCISYLLLLYEEWDRAEPGQGHDVNALAWRGKLLPEEASASSNSLVGSNPATTSSSPDAKSE